MEELIDDASFARAARKVWLIAATKPAVIASLEHELGMTQAEAVDELIEESCWREDLPEFYGHRRTPEERIKALRKAIGSLPGNDFAMAMRPPN